MLSAAKSAFVMRPLAVVRFCTDVPMLLIDDVRRFWIAPQVALYELIVAIAESTENSVLLAVQHPATDALEKSSIALQTSHVPKERADKTMKEIGVDVQKYIDTTMPLAIASAKKNVGPAVGPLLAQNFTTEELRQLVALLESPVKSKFEKLLPQLENAVGQKVQADVGVQANKNIQVLTESVGTKLRVAATLN